MNFLLWTLQILLALYNLVGGLYTAFNYQQLKGTMVGEWPQFVWLAICALQVLFAIGLVLPGAAGILPKMTSISAIYLAFNSLLGCVLFAQYAGFPGMLWGVVPALLAAFVAFGRWV